MIYIMSGNVEGGIIRPPIIFLQNAGLYVAEGFFEPDLCRRIVNEMRAAKPRGSDILQEGERATTKLRTALGVYPSRETEQEVQDRFTKAMPGLSAHYQADLSGFEPPQFLMYPPGTYYLPHTDSVLLDFTHIPEPDRSDPNHIANNFLNRRVSASVFLNDESEKDSEDTYSGGSLAFEGEFIPTRPGWYAPLGTAGLLVAFPSIMRHQVTEVKRGVRYSIVSWFYRPDQP